MSIYCLFLFVLIFFFKHQTAYEMRISYWSSDLCSSDLNLTSVTTVTAMDPDAGAVLAYSIVGGPDRALFSIDPSTGALAFLSPPNYDLPGDANGNNVYSLTVRVSDGALFDDRSEEHTSELRSLMRTSYACFGLKKKTQR